MTCDEKVILMSEAPVLEVRGITKSFGATAALSDVSLEVHAGEIRALVGQNGAGKSTLVKIMTGIYGHSFDGQLRIKGTDVRLNRPQDARLLGIGYAPQEIDVAEHLSVTENVLAGHLSPGLFFRRRIADATCAAVLARLGLNVSPRAIVSTLSAAERQMLMVARALALDPSLVILDEPTTSLADSEAEALGDVIVELASQGLAVLYVTHRVQEVLRICDGATVLRDGKVVEHLGAAELSTTRIVTAMAGRTVVDLFPGRSYEPQDVVMNVEHLTVRNQPLSATRVTDVSFQLHRGEILGIAGLLGSGRSELLASIYGGTGRRGTVVVNGQEVRQGHPRFARSVGLGMLTEERKREGLLFNLPVVSNITLGSLLDVARGGIIRPALERETALKVIADLAIKAPRLSSSVDHLSGGNQQKLLIGRTLLAAPKIVLLDEPTKGIDVGTRQQIYQLMGRLADGGISLVVVSSELDELLGLCDRFIVLADGHMVDEFNKGDGGETRILASIAGSSDEAVLAGAE